MQIRRLYVSRVLRSAWDWLLPVSLLLCLQSCASLQAAGGTVELKSADHGLYLFLKRVNLFLKLLVKIRNK